MTEIESVLVDREVDALVGMALAYAADGQLKLATEIAEKVERLAPWSPRYLQLQVYLDEEGARKRADDLVARAREYAGAGRIVEGQAAVREALLFMPGHAPAGRLSQELAEAAALLAAQAPAPERPQAHSLPPTRGGIRGGLRGLGACPRSRGSRAVAKRPGRPRTPPQPVSAEAGQPPAAVYVAPLSRAGCRPEERRGRRPQRRRAPTLPAGRARAGAPAGRARPGSRPQNRKALELEKILRVLG
jgi:hypothetical protein